MEETSLSDFIDGERDAGGDSGRGDGAEGDAGGDESGAGETPAGEPGSAASPTDESGAAPDGPAVTAAYRPAGGTCERCDSTVAWRWTDGEERVCRDCKDW